jgi:hypothetical protein
MLGYKGILPTLSECLKVRKASNLNFKLHGQLCKKKWSTVINIRAWGSTFMLLETDAKHCIPSRFESQHESRDLVCVSTAAAPASAPYCQTGELSIGELCSVLMVVGG